MVIFCTAIIVVSIAGAAYYVCHTINDATTDIYRAMRELHNEIESFHSDVSDAIPEQR